MQILFHRNFKKAFKKQPVSIQKKFFKRTEFFVEDQFHPLLNNHALTGAFKGWRSFDVTGDVRVHYEEYKGKIIFMDIGAHAQLY